MSGGKGVFAECCGVATERTPAKADKARACEQLRIPKAVQNSVYRECSQMILNFKIIQAGSCCRARSWPAGTLKQCLACKHTSCSVKALGLQDDQSKGPQLSSLLELDHVVQKRYQKSN